MKQKFFLVILVIAIFTPFSRASAARLWSTGFELQSFNLEYDISSGMQMGTSYKRSGRLGGKFAAPSAGYMRKDFFSSAQHTLDVYSRFYVYIKTPASSDETMLVISSLASGLAVYGIGIGSSNQLTLIDGDGGSDDTSVALNSGEWYRVESKYISSSADTEVKIYDSYGDPVDTLAGNSNYPNDDPARFQLGNSGATGEFYVDDIAINDSAGSYQNGYPGEGRIVFLYPNAAGDIDETDSTPDGYLKVDEKYFLDTTSIAGFLANDADFLVNVEDHAAAGIGNLDKINLVQVGYYHRDSTTTGTSVFIPKMESQSNGTLLSGTELGDPGTTCRFNGGAVPRNYKLTSYVDPQTGGVWTPALLDTMQIGGTATTVPPYVGISSMVALIEYVAAPTPEVIIKSSPGGPTIFRRNVILNK